MPIIPETKNKNMPPSTLVTCHANSDFDAFAAVVAASYLYPDSVLLFPGTQERPLYEFFSESASFMYNFKDAKQIAFEDITRLVIVDTRQHSRVPHVHELLKKPGLEVHLWDHHPDSADDISAVFCRAEAVGATVTLLIRELIAREVKLHCQDATILGLGIYADTGSFTFASTTVEDFKAAAWLRIWDMDITFISDLVAHDLTSAQVQILNTLIESAHIRVFNGIPVAMAEINLPHYLGDFAFMAHKLMEMERFEVLFVLGSMGDRIQVVARSRKDEIDVGQICKALGGGGHSYAASASSRERSMTEIREEILTYLFALTSKVKTARDYMSSPVIGIEEHKNLHDAEEVMLRFGLKAVPVFQTGTRQCVGMLDYQMTAKAAVHKLPNIPIDIYMQRNTATVSPDDGLQEITNIIIGMHQRLVPVVEDGNVIGVVTRTDLINVFAEESGRLATQSNFSLKEKNISKLLRDRLPRDILELLEKIGRLGKRLGLPVYAVGGFARDLIMNRPNNDIDLVVEGNGIAFARELAKELGGRVREHQKFLTSIVIYEKEPGDVRHIDVATARLEYYEHPAALPTVELSSLKMDLFRRDFTINTLAVRLEKDHFGRLVDFFGGQRDIKDKVIRVLHNLSFVEDPTRCLRAIRFEQRYGFRVSSGAEKLIKNAISSLSLITKLSGARLFHELKLICEEPSPLACLKRLDEIGLLGAIHPTLTLNSVKIALLEKLQEINDWYRLLYFEDQPEPWRVYLLGLCRNLTYQESMEVFDRLGLPQNQKEDLVRTRENVRFNITKVEEWQRTPGKVSVLYNILAQIPVEGLLYMMGRTESEALRKSLSRHITQWRGEKVEITGQDLKDMGLTPGPEFRKVLGLLLEAKLDGEAVTRDAQYLLAMKLVRAAMKRKEELSGDMGEIYARR